MKFSSIGVIIWITHAGCCLVYFVNWTGIIRVQLVDFGKFAYWKDNNNIIYQLADADIVMIHLIHKLNQPHMKLTS